MDDMAQELGHQPQEPALAPWEILDIVKEMQQLDLSMTVRDASPAALVDADWLAEAINEVRKCHFLANTLRANHRLPAPVLLAPEQVDRFFFNPEQPKGGQ